jgi:hypothetical protein
MPPGCLDATRELVHQRALDIDRQGVTLYNLYLARQSILGAVVGR